MKLYTYYASKDSLDNFIRLGIIPTIILRNIRESNILMPYADTYVHLRELSPSTDLFQKFKNNQIDVEEYHYQYLIELLDRHISTFNLYKKFKSLCRICNTDKIVLLGYSIDPNYCHRRALAEFLGKIWNIEIDEWSD